MTLSGCCLHASIIFTRTVSISGLRDARYALYVVQKLQMGLRTSYRRTVLFLCPCQQGLSFFVEPSPFQGAERMDIRRMRTMRCAGREGMETCSAAGVDCKRLRRKRFFTNRCWMLGNQLHLYSTAKGPCIVVVVLCFCYNTLGNKCPAPGVLIL